jgi:hypothetical protein
LIAAIFAFLLYNRAKIAFRFTVKVSRYRLAFFSRLSWRLKKIPWRKNLKNLQGTINLLILFSL